MAAWSYRAPLLTRLAEECLKRAGRADLGGFLGGALVATARTCESRFDCSR
jgi:hypothetical protein